jgi:hypothetical protein
MLRRHDKTCRFVFAIVLGAGIEEVKGRLAAVRSGEVGLRLQQHVLVLNWWVHCTAPHCNALVGGRQVGRAGAGR